MTGVGQLQLITKAQQNADILNNMSSSHQVHELSSPLCKSNNTKNNNQHQECRKTDSHSIRLHAADQQRKMCFTYALNNSSTNH